MLKAVLIFVGALWAVYVVDLVVPIDLTAYGLVPRTASGLVGIVTMPFLHSGLRHLLANTVPLAILLLLLAGSRPRAWEIVVEIVVASGILLWLFGRSGDHVGASGLVFGLIAFLILAGLLEKKPMSLVIAVAVAFFYGGTLLLGVVPIGHDGVSWDGHLAGVVAGAGSAYFLAGMGRRKLPARDSTEEEKR